VRSPALRELQEAFWRSLDAAPDPALIAAVAPAPPLEVEARVGIYAGMYVHRIVEALREDFPRLAAVIGDEPFAALVRRYLARHPSTHPSLRHVGAALPAFLADGEGLPAYVSDVARLEWTRLGVFDAPDAVPLARDDLRGVPADEWPLLRFAMVPAAAKLVVAWPVHRIWTGDDPAAFTPARTALRVWRDGFLVYQSPMEAAEEAAFDRLAGGDTFAAVCEAVGDAAGAAGILLRWVEDGLLARTW
jgi:hypothetical protein